MSSEHQKSGQRQASKRAASAPAHRGAPGKRTRTMGLPPRAPGGAAPVQAKDDPAARATGREHSATAAQWMDVAMRPDLHDAPVQMSKGAIYDTDSTSNPKGALGSRQPYSSTVTPLKKTDVTFGALNGDGCGTSMEAIVLDPGDIPKGSAPSVKPPWWPSPSSSWWSNNLVQGHLLNHNIGGPGDDMRNLSPITKTANSAHLHNVEKAMKSMISKQAKKMYYNVTVDYSSAPTLTDIPLPDNKHLISKFPKGFDCYWATYDAQEELIDADYYAVKNKK